MTRDEIFGTIDRLRAKGWTFDVTVDVLGWSCQITGAGLAHADVSGISFEKTVEDAIRLASDMEDDPQVIISRYDRVIRELAEKALGKGNYRGLSVYEDRPKRIQMTVLIAGDITSFIDREMDLWRMLMELPKEISGGLMMDYEYPKEAVHA